MNICKRSSSPPTDRFCDHNPNTNSPIAMSSSSRPYDLILFGATGYTGRYCAQHLTTHLPSTLTWAVAGRSASKLRGVVEEIRSLNPDRKQPGVEECQLDDAELDALAKKTKVLVNCVGPYALYGEGVLKACAENGTAYVDTTGEVPWVLKMVRRYHERARETGAVIIPQCGFESCASDLLVHTAIRTLHSLYSAPAGHVTGTVHSVKGSVSGGTLATIFTALDVFSISELLEASKPFVLSPVPRDLTAHPASAPQSLLTRLIKTHVDPILGAQATFPMAGANTAIVQRSWGLYDGGEYYGRDFTYAEYLRVPNRLVGLAVNLGVAAVAMMLALPPVRWVARRWVTQPGEGASKEDSAREGFEFRAVAEAGDGSGRKVMSRMAWKGGIYHVTAVYMMEAAATLLGEKTKAHEIGGGILTPATLGEPFADRLRKAGLALEASSI